MSTTQTAKVNDQVDRCPTAAPTKPVWERADTCRHKGITDDRRGNGFAATPLGPVADWPGASMPKRAQCATNGFLAPRDHRQRT
jgi:hypothetical protein